MMFPAAFLAFVLSAPALKSDCTCGELRITGGQTPVLVRQERMPEGHFDKVTYWLVFAPDSEIAKQAVSLGGMTVKIHGTKMQGGIYRYIIVDRIAKD